MLLIWNVQYLDRKTKQFGTRYLYLNTHLLPPLERAAIELVVDARGRLADRDITRYRHLFVEHGEDVDQEELGEFDRFSTVGPTSYFEDETGAELTHDDIARIVTGSPTARSIPSGASQHDIDYMFADPKPVPLSQVSLSPEEVRLLGYFCRDLTELLESTFMKDGPATLRFGKDHPEVTSSVNAAEIESFVMTFRRLYMSKEPANLSKAVEVFTRALGDHPIARLVQGRAQAYEQGRQVSPDEPPVSNSGKLTFTVKRLIDVFLYTLYAHQPDETRQRQFSECLQGVGGSNAVLTWLFLTELWKLALEIGNAGRIIAWWFSHYCKHHGVLPDVLGLLHQTHQGIGVDEKEEAKRKRLFEESAAKLASEFWQKAGRPDGGPTRFLGEARAMLSKHFDDDV